MPVSYDGIIKKPGIEEEYTQEQIIELVKCSKDPEYFLKNYVKILHPDKGWIPFILYPHQKRMLKEFQQNRMVISKVFRQGGKCLYSDSYITIRNKNTKEVEKITIEEFYNRFQK